MPVVLSDSEIAALVQEKKRLPADYRQRLKLKSKPGHKERELDIRGENGSDFRLVLRQSSLNHLDFSVILAYVPPNSNQSFRLCRYNGKSHEHTNKIEGKTFYDFHVHRATERYQATGIREDGFAQPTAHYADFESAVACMIKDCGFELPPNDQGQLTF